MFFKVTLHPMSSSLARFLPFSVFVSRSLSVLVAQKQRLRTQSGSIFLEKEHWLPKKYNSFVKNHSQQGRELGSMERLRKEQTFKRLIVACDGMVSISASTGSSRSFQDVFGLPFANLRVQAHGWYVLSLLYSVDQTIKDDSTFFPAATLH